MFDTLQGHHPPVTVIICARNAAGHLTRSVTGALGQDYPAHRLRVLVVDNGSSDGTAEVAARLGAVVRRYAKPGIAGAREFGWRRSRSELVAYLDADCEPPRDWLARLVPMFAEDASLGAVGCRLVSADPQTLAEIHIDHARVLDTDRFFERNTLQWPFVVTAGMVARRSALEAVDGFDRTLDRNTGEDADLCWRLGRAGWRVHYARHVVLLHHHRASVPAMLRQVYWYGKSSSALFARWRGELGWWRYTDWGPYRRVLGGVMRTPRALATGRSRYERFTPLLEALEAGAFLAGKWRGALEHRVLFF